MNRSKYFGIALPLVVLAKIDNKRGDVPRSKYFQRLAERDLLLLQAGEKEKKNEKQKGGNAEGVVRFSPATHHPSATYYASTDTQSESRSGSYER